MRLNKYLKVYWLPAMVGFIFKGTLSNGRYN